jgi:aminocarboxymuconate-semialdehyde decarboxylase
MLFDADGHYAPKFAYDRMEGPYRHLRPRIVTDSHGSTLFYNERFHPSVAHSFNEQQTCDIKRRLADLDKLGIEMQVLFPNHSGLYYDVEDPKAAAALCQNHNDGVAEAEKLGRFIAPAMVPLQHPDEAIAELQRVVKVHGLRCLVVNPNVNGDTVDRIDLWDFYAEAEHLGVSLLFHGDADSRLVGYERFQNKYRLPTCLGFPFDYMVAITCLIYSGILDRFPNLKVMFAEGGVSYLPFLEDRLGDTLETYKAPWARDNFAIRGRPNCKREPREYLNRIHHVIGLDESLLEFVIDRYGSDLFMIGTDYPHPDAHTNAAKHVEELSNMSKDVLEKITWKNAARFFGLSDKAKVARAAAE